MFRPKKLDLGCFINIRVIRDDAKRQIFQRHEAERCVSLESCSRTVCRELSMLTLVSQLRQALRHIIRNTTLPPRARAEAQLQLTQMPVYSRPTQIRNRCILGGKSRGVLRDFKLSRVGGTQLQEDERACYAASMLTFSV